jgi:hypothetical protein
MQILPIPYPSQTYTGLETRSMKATPKSSQKKQKPFVFNLHHHTILREALYPYHLVTDEQIIKLLFNQGSRSTVKAHLAAMAEQKLTGRIVLPTATGRRPYLNYLGIQGKRVLEREDGYTVTTYYEYSDLQTRSFGWKMHLLELNDFLIAARLLSKSVPEITLADWLHDFTITKNPPSALGKNGERIVIEPDGFLHFIHTLQVAEREKKRHYYLLVELDRGTETLTKIAEKIRGYLYLFETGTLHKHFNAYSPKGEQLPLIIVFPTTDGETRLAALRKCARLELEAYKSDVKASSWINIMFKFASIPPLKKTPLEPKTLFCSPIWQTAIGETTEALIREVI